MNAADIMTTPVVTIAPDAQIREIAALLLEKRISGVPVVDGGRMVGVVNEADLLRRHEIGTDAAAPERSWWAQLIRPERLSVDYVKTHAGRAQDAATRTRRGGALARHHQLARRELAGPAVLLELEVDQIAFIQAAKACLLDR